MEISLRIIDRRELPGFRQYLLPSTAKAIERGDQSVMALGAVSGPHSVGAAAMRLDTRERATLTDLFVDETVRRQGIGATLVVQLVCILSDMGCRILTADYTLDEEDITAMDALLDSIGFDEPYLRSVTFRAWAGDYREDPVFGPCFRSGFKTPEGVVTVSELPDEALKELENAGDIPYNLSWGALRDRAEPELSVALFKDGRVLAYILSEESADDGFVILSAVSREDAPATAFMAMFTDMLNRCFYWRGGDFPLYFSAVNGHTERLARGLMRNSAYTEYMEHVCSLAVPEAEVIESWEAGEDAD